MGQSSRKIKNATSDMWNIHAVWLTFAFDGMISGLLYVAAIIFSIIGVINAGKGHMKRLPIIGDLRLL